MVEHELVTVSSTDLREKLQQGKSSDEQLHSSTIEYISNIIYTVDYVYKQKSIY